MLRTFGEIRDMALLLHLGQDLGNGRSSDPTLTLTVDLSYPCCQPAAEVNVGVRASSLVSFHHPGIRSVKLTGIPTMWRMILGS